MLTVLGTIFGVCCCWFVIGSMRTEMYEESGGKSSRAYYSVFEEGHGSYIESPQRPLFFLLLALYPFLCSIVQCQKLVVRRTKSKIRQ
jgi:hypothetical protein